MWELGCQLIIMSYRVHTREWHTLFRNQRERHPLSLDRRFKIEDRGFKIPEAEHAECDFVNENQDVPTGYIDKWQRDKSVTKGHV